MVYMVVEGDRLLFRLEQGPGRLRSASKKNPQSIDCGFARGESLNTRTEVVILAAAQKAKDWDNFVFKLKLEGFDVREGATLKGHIGKL